MDRARAASGQHAAFVDAAFAPPNLGRRPVTGVHIVLGALLGAALGLAVTGGWLWLVRRFGGPIHPGHEGRLTRPMAPGSHDGALGAAGVGVPPSPEVLEAERQYQRRHTHTSLRPPTPPRPS